MSGSNEVEPGPSRLAVVFYGEMATPCGIHSVLREESLRVLAVGWEAASG